MNRTKLGTRAPASLLPMSAGRTRLSRWPRCSITHSPETLAASAGSEAVLPGYVAGLVIAGIFLHDRMPEGPAQLG
jgi:hypothetical protein